MNQFLPKILSRGVLPALLLFCMALPADAGDPPVIVSGLTDYPPVMWAEGQTLKGIAAELTDRIFEELGVA